MARPPVLLRRFNFHKSFPIRQSMISVRITSQPHFSFMLALLSIHLFTQFGELGWVGGAERRPPFPNSYSPDI
ncbi:MAG: hypothetical protein ACE5JB_16315 [bacterium]